MPCSTGRSPTCAASPSARCRRRSTTAARPQAPIRWLNHWDNVDGTIERGYGGRSIFWEGGKVRDDLGAGQRLRTAARLARDQRPLDHQRQRQPGVPDAGVPAADRQGCRRAAALGRAGRHLGRLRQPAEGRQARDLRSARSRRDQVVEDEGRRDLCAPCPISAASCSRRIPKGASAPPLTSARMPMRPTSSRGRSSRTAACSSTAGSSTTTRWTGAT